MEFYEYPTTRDMIVRGTGHKEKPETFYNRNLDNAITRIQSIPCAVQMVNEGTWETQRRPYYNVYPAIAPMLIRLSLDVSTEFLKLPLPVFAIRFPKEHPPIKFQWQGEDWHIRSMLVGPTTLTHETGIISGLVIWVDTGEVQITHSGVPFYVHTYINFPIGRGISLEEALRALPWDATAREGMQMPDEVRLRPYYHLLIFFLILLPSRYDPKASSITSFIFLLCQ